MCDSVCGILVSQDAKNTIARFLNFKALKIDMFTNFLNLYSTNKECVLEKQRRAMTPIRKYDVNLRLKSHNAVNLNELILINSASCV